ncbi:SLBB domain-containing protein [Gammaproteobacteria bacterium]|nr:SLBB domain-containing protein [Gammaproteobacteria bacterium]
MNSKTRVMIIFLLASSSIANAQLDSLELLSSMAGVEETTTKSEIPTEEEPREEGNNNFSKDKNSFRDNQYGYTGGKNFNNPPKTKFSNEALEYFGYNYFLDQSSTFAPKNNSPIPPDYLIGPDDNIKIILFGNTNKKYELRVTRDGDIFIPKIGPLYVAGISFLDLKDLIKTTINNQLIGTKVSVTLGALRSIDIFILGAAKNPGMFSISALSTLTNAIIQSGGIDVSGSLRDIKLKRNGRIITSFDFYELLLNGDTSNDQRLMQGDVVFIETIGKTAAVTGEINRPGIYELKDSENLSELIRYAGNVKPKANLLNAEITRINPSTNSFDLVSVNLNNQDNENLKVSNGDTISVYPVPDNLNQAILILGHAQQPGFYPWKPSIKMFDLFNSPNDLLEMTDLNYVLVKRKEAKSLNYSFLQVDLEKLFADPESEENILLSDQDEIILFPSLLSSDLITTKMIQDKYVRDEETNTMILEDQWTSLTYLRKSLMEEMITVEEQSTMLGDETAKIEENPNKDIGRYYEYSIYEYCKIPEKLAIKIIEESGFRTEKSIPMSELEKLNTPQDFLVLQQTLKKERLTIKNSNDIEKIDISTTITNLCRKQLLDPVLDLIKRNAADHKLKMVSVFGNVHFPGTYPYTKDMILSDAIKAGGGPKNRTYEAEVELSSINNVGKKFSTTNDYTSLIVANEIKLQEMDTINLKQISSDLKTVIISGEVFFPGTYPISENETLRGLISRAGGLTDYASPQAAYFQRDALKEAEEVRFKNAQDELRKKVILSSQSAGLGQESIDNNSIIQLTSLITGDTGENDALGRLVIDLDAILNQDIDDIILEDGDSLIIPKRKQSISVIGEVFVANSHLYENSLSLYDYINLSGGTTIFADENNIYLIKSDGSIVSPSQLSGSGFFRTGKSNLEPGDTIVVPLSMQPFSAVKATTEITQIIYQMALAAAAVNSF